MSPGVEPAAGELLELAEFALGSGPRGLRHVAQELQHLVHAARHAPRQRIGCIVGEVEQLRGLVPQAQQVFHHLAVVELCRVRAGGGGACAPGAVRTPAAAPASGHR